MTANTKITIAGVTKQFDGAAGETVNALERVDLDITDGEFVSILGPSGCGKSSLLNIIAGFEPSSSGRIEVDGKSIEGPEPNRGVVFQEYALFPWLTVTGNIGFGPASRGFRQSEIDKLVVRYTTLVGLQGFERKYPHEGLVTLRNEERKRPVFHLSLGDCDRKAPSVHRRGAEAAVRRR